jgi:hypothetical protein
MDNAAMDSLKKVYLPEELRGLAVFFNTKLLGDLFNGEHSHTSLITG